MAISPPEPVETIGFVQGLNAHFSSKLTAPQFTNNTQHDLTDLDMKITFNSREPGVPERHENVHWDSWRKGEKRTPEISVEKGKYYKVFVKGTAKRDGTPVKVSFGAEIFGGK